MRGLCWGDDWIRMGGGVGAIRRFSMSVYLFLSFFLSPDIVAIGVDKVTCLHVLNDISRSSCPLNPRITSPKTHRGILKAPPRPIRSSIVPAYLFH